MIREFDHKVSFYEQYTKRFLDILLSVTAIVLLSWLIVIISVLVRVKIGKPVIFRHPRPGKNEEIFNMYKFRTMTNEKDSDGNLLPDAKRLTSFGKKLRSTSLDELPELFLILNGKMSIVGPRPLEVYFLPYYTEKEHLRHAVKPGLTGLAQINGRNNLSWEEKFAYDLEYVKTISFKTDIKIVLGTIRKVLSGDGVVAEGGGAIVDFDVERKNQMEKK